jgi:putative transposase
MLTKAFKYRIYPTSKQEKRLEETLTTCRHLYNTALDQRRDIYKQTKKSLSYVEQANSLSKNKNSYQIQVYSQVLQSTLKRLDQSFKNFFRRLKERQAGKHTKVGFPRFKPSQRFNSFTYPQSGFRFTNNNQRIQLSKIGTIKLRYHRSLQGRIKTCQVLRDVDQWFIVLTCEQEQFFAPQSQNPTIGVDVGISTLAVLSDGTEIQNPRHTLKSQYKLRKAQRRLSRRQKGSNNRNKQRISVSKVHRNIRRQRDDYLHKLSDQLVKKYGCIIFEDLNISGMLKNHELAKHISDCSWNKLIQYTQYKAESAGVEVRLVNPRNTSQICSNCGKIVPKELKDRVHRCPHCGLVINRDFNASINICTAGSAGINAFGDLASTYESKICRQAGSLN